MKSVEMVIVAILGLMLLPDFCKRIGRPALLYSLYVLMGVILGGILDENARELLKGVGGFGFILLLFLVGLEIDLPGWRDAHQALARAAGWMIFQTPLIVVIAGFLFIPTLPALLSAVALTSCSVGMAFSAWKNFPFQTTPGKQAILLWMIALEVVGIIWMALGETLLIEGIGFSLLYKVMGLCLAVFLIARYSNLLASALKVVLQWFAQWKTHLSVLLIFGVSAIGERLGLSAPKSAFFFGMFIHSATRDGLTLEQDLEPIAQRLLIPIFFVSIGTLVTWSALLTAASGIALATALVILGVREMLFRRIWIPLLEEPRQTFLLLSPNLTIVAIAVKILHETPYGEITIPWLLLTGLWVSLLSTILLPQQSEIPSAAVVE
ncbi:MAG: cation:proton antiporter [Verrucomicrobiota bacterium]